MSIQQIVLFESASGYALFDIIESEEIGSLLSHVQSSIMDLAKFGRFVKLKAFQPFTSAENALENINTISEGLLTDDLIHFLEMNLPKISKKSNKTSNFTLGVYDKNLSISLNETLKIMCNSNETTLEILRGIRLHFSKFIKELSNGGLDKAQLGLGHSYSRAKVKFNVNRQDNMIIQSISLLDQLDKDINTFAMRIREWYSWHFPELIKIVNDNYIYARCAAFIKNRTNLTDDKLNDLIELTNDEEMAKEIIHTSRTSMGMDMSEIDMVNIDNFATRLINLANYRKQLSNYLTTKMNNVAPNLGALIGDSVAARLISHAGSLTNLAKCPASTVQILGAEKALFRALKTRGNTPKYGLIFHSSFIGRAGSKNKGRISRYLANKCSIASRIDSFIDEPTTKYGLEMKEQVEERLKFYESGATPRKNLDVMNKVSKDLFKLKEMEDKKISKKRKAEDNDIKNSDNDSDNDNDNESNEDENENDKSKEEKHKKKKLKKDKKNKKESKKKSNENTKSITIIASPKEDKTSTTISSTTNSEKKKKKKKKKSTN